MRPDKHSNIAIFVPHAGCPYHCAFCNQHTITEQDALPHSRQVQEICQQAFQSMDENARSNTEIAFFGGSFTAIPRNYMIELLESVQEFLGEHKFSGIRISTRPDCINPEILKLLKSYHVTSIELGTQSMSDKVLFANHRGHTAQDVIHASELIRDYDFELGLQIMMGLYQSTWEDEWATFRKVSEIRPDTVRIYPVVILKHTLLGDLYESGEYQLFSDPKHNSLEDVVEATAQFMSMFMIRKIKILKVGLHASEFVERDMLGGYYHPAFRELCESRIYRIEIEKSLKLISAQEVTLRVNPRCISKMIGQKRENINYLQRNLEMKINIKPDPAVEAFQFKILQEH